MKVYIPGLVVMLLSQKVALAQCTPEQTEAMRSAGMAETQIQAACPSSSQCTSNQRKAMQNAGMSREQIEAACNVSNVSDFSSLEGVWRMRKNNYRRPGITMPPNLREMEGLDDFIWKIEVSGDKIKIEECHFAGMTYAMSRPGTRLEDNCHPTESGLKTEKVTPVIKSNAVEFFFNDVRYIIGLKEIIDRGEPKFSNRRGYYYPGNSQEEVELWKFIGQ